MILRNKSSIALLILSACSIVLGVVCMAYPAKTMLTIAFFGALFILLLGVGCVFFYLQSMRKMAWILIDGIVSILIAIALFVALIVGGEEMGEQIIALIIGIGVLCNGILWILTARSFKQFDGSVFLPTLSFGVICVVLGIVFAIFPQILSFLISIFLGILLIIFGSLGLVLGFTSRRRF